MDHLADRISGLFCLLSGLALFFLVIPAHTETVGYGWVLPATLPNLVSITIAVAGAFVALRPAPRKLPSARRMVRALALALLIAAGLFLVSRIGFAPVSPFLALAIMLLAGERRPSWLAAGALLGPGFIWLMVAVMLDRPLP